MDNPRDIADIIDLWQGEESPAHITFREELKENVAYLKQLFFSGIPGKILASAFMVLFLCILSMLFVLLYYLYAVFNKNLSARSLVLSIIEVICFLGYIMASITVLCIGFLDQRGVISLPKVKDTHVSNVEYLGQLIANSQIDIIFLSDYCTSKLEALDRSVSKADRWWNTIIISVLLGILIATIPPLLSFILEAYKHEALLSNLPFEILISTLFSFFKVLMMFVFFTIVLYVLGFFIIRLWFKYVCHRNAYQSLSEAIESYKVFNLNSKNLSHRHLDYVYKPNIGGISRDVKMKHRRRGCR